MLRVVYVSGRRCATRPSLHAWTTGNSRSSSSSGSRSGSRPGKLIHSASAALTAGEAWNAPSTTTEAIVASASSGVTSGCNAGKAQHVNVETLFGVSHQLQVLPRKMLQAQRQCPAANRVMHGLGVESQLVADCCADQIGLIRVKAFFDQQIDLAEVDRAEIDGDPLCLAALRTRWRDKRLPTGFRCHFLSIYHLAGWSQAGDGAMSTCE